VALSGSDRLGLLGKESEKKQVRTGSGGLLRQISAETLLAGLNPWEMPPIVSNVQLLTEYHRHQLFHIQDVVKYQKKNIVFVLAKKNLFWIISMLITDRKHHKESSLVESKKNKILFKFSF
jgi:hypothetical protein